MRPEMREPQLQGCLWGNGAAGSEPVLCVRLLIRPPAGTKKKLRVTRHITDAASNKSVPVQEVVELDVRPGWKSGTRVTFEGKGDELPGR